jgi:hypothetical protein
MAGEIERAKLTDKFLTNKFLICKLWNGFSSKLKSNGSRPVEHRTGCLESD